MLQGKPAVYKQILCFWVACVNHIRFKLYLSFIGWNIKLWNLYYFLKIWDL